MYKRQPLDVVIVIRRFSLLQLLVKNFTIDSITVKPLQTTYAPGVDYMADYDEWLFIQVSIYTYIYIYNIYRW